MTKIDEVKRREKTMHEKKSISNGGALARTGSCLNVICIVSHCFCRIEILYK